MLLESLYLQILRIGTVLRMSLMDLIQNLSSDSHLLLSRQRKGNQKKERKETKQLKELVIYYSISRIITYIYM